jgi:D-aminoacyl-tRNA deacylase
MKRLLVCSEPDLPSVNMRKHLLAMGGWEDAGSCGELRFMSKGDDMMVSIPDMHIRHERLDSEVRDFGFSPDEVIVMSKHSAKSGQPALTAHPIGNYHENQFGGRERALVKAAPAAMTDALRRILSYNDMDGTQTCFEVTHHGPWMDRPTFYIEIGSDESNWGNDHAAEVLAHVIADLDPDYDAPRMVGVGGGHYAPRFTEVAAKFRVSFGHMLPVYQMEGRDDEDIIRMVRDACEATETRTVYVHRKSMKKPEERRITELIQSAGFETVTSADLEPLSGNPRRCPRTAVRGWPF